MMWFWGCIRTALPIHFIRPQQGSGAPFRELFTKLTFHEINHQLGDCPMRLHGFPVAPWDRRGGLP